MASCFRSAVPCSHSITPSPSLSKPGSNAVGRPAAGVEQTVGGGEEEVHGRAVKKDLKSFLRPVSGLRFQRNFPDPEQLV